MAFILTFCFIQHGRKAWSTERICLIIRAQRHISHLCGVLVHKSRFSHFSVLITASRDCIYSGMLQQTFKKKNARLWPGLSQHHTFFFPSLSLLNQSVCSGAALVWVNESVMKWEQGRGGGEISSWASVVKWSDQEIVRGSPHLDRPIHPAMHTSYATDILNHSYLWQGGYKSSCMAWSQLRVSLEDRRGGQRGRKIQWKV